MDLVVGGLVPIGERAVIAAAVRWADVLYLSGRTAVDPRTFAIRRRDFPGQARLILDETIALLTECGSDRSLILRVECYLADAKHYAVWNEVWTEYFPSTAPARTTVVSTLALPGLLLELQVTAAVSPSPATTNADTR
jgi:2-iminobutanoate/2-iminopropanoate deaminase